MNMEQIIKFNEQHKEARPKSSLIYLAENDFDFASQISDERNLPTRCPSKLLKLALENNLETMLLKISYASLDYINNSDLCNPENIGPTLKIVGLMSEKNVTIVNTLQSKGLLNDVVNFIRDFDTKYDIAIDNLYYLVKINTESIETLISRITLLNAHDKEFLKEPLLREMECEDALDVLNRLSGLTKDRFNIIKQYDKRSDLSSIRPAYVWGISRSVWKNFTEVIDKYELSLNSFKSLTVEQIEKFLENFEKASEELQTLCKKDSLAITCVINDFKYQDFVLSSYMDYQQELRDSIVAHALANDKVRFLQLITNRSDLLHQNKQATKLLMQKDVYTKFLDINTMHVDDFATLGQWEISDWPEYKEISIMLSSDEFIALLGKPKQYIHFMCECKRKNCVNIEALNELFENKLLPKSTTKAVTLAQKLNGKLFSEVYTENFGVSRIGYKNAVRLLNLCDIKQACQVQDVYDVALVLETFKDVIYSGDFTMDNLLEEKGDALLQNPKMQTYKERYGDAFDTMIHNGLADVLNMFIMTKVPDEVYSYLEKLLDIWKQGELCEDIYSSNNMRYELESTLPENTIAEWRHNVEQTLGEFTVREIDSFEEKMFLCCKLNSRYSYKNDTGIALSIMDATKKLIAVYYHDDCVGIATLRLTKVGSGASQGAKTQNEFIVYLSGVEFAPEIGPRLEKEIITLMFRIALQKSYDTKCLLVLEKSYGERDLGIEMQKTSMKIFNNRSRNFIQFFNENKYRSSWDSLVTYTNSTVMLIK